MSHFVEIWEYKRPNGMSVPHPLEVSKDTFDQCGLIQSKGFRFECELLTTGHVSATITDDDADHAITVFANKQGAFESHFSKMVAKFAQELEPTP
jgi:hypothetical protein